MSELHQPGILDAVPALARYITFRLEPDADPTAALRRLAERPRGKEMVVGVGPATVNRLGKTIEHLDEPDAVSAQGISIPSTPAALWCWLRGSDRGELFHAGRALTDLVADAFSVDSIVDAFMYRDSRDLTGYIDGTENPEGQKAVDAVFSRSREPGLGGSSFVAVQKWVHDLHKFQSFDRKEQDNVFGRRQSDNEEFEDAPASAHVKRTAQESFTPQAFIVRRSMPWCQAEQAGLMFVAFGQSFDAFEALLLRMVGLDDGTQDALFRFTRPVTTSYFWCPPLHDGRLDLRALGFP